MRRLAGSAAMALLLNHLLAAPAAAHGGLTGIHHLNDYRLLIALALVVSFCAVVVLYALHLPPDDV